MGDRANIEIRENNLAAPVYLYTHWSGTELPAILQAALRKSPSRWDDSPYLTRIIFCEMVKDDIDGLTGFGISSMLQDGGDRVLCVNVYSGTVQRGHNGEKLSFNDYAGLDPEALAAFAWS